PCTVDSDARETSPAADLLARLLDRCLGACQEHATHDAHPSGRAVTGVRHHDRNVTAAQRTLLSEAVDSIVDPGAQVELGRLASFVGGGAGGCIHCFIL